VYVIMVPRNVVAYFSSCTASLSKQKIFFKSPQLELRFSLVYSLLQKLTFASIFLSPILQDRIELEEKLVYVW